MRALAKTPGAFLSLVFGLHSKKCGLFYVWYKTTCAGLAGLQAAFPLPGQFRAWRWQAQPCR
jgi:hypothetical protein